MVQFGILAIFIVNFITKKKTLLYYKSKQISFLGNLVDFG